MRERGPGRPGGPETAGSVDPREEPSVGVIPRRTPSSMVALLRSGWASLAGRRRFLLLVAVGALPIVVALLYRAIETPVDSQGAAWDLVSLLVVAGTLPIAGLVMGTAALGGEIDDDSILHLLVTPVARWRIVVARYVASVVGTVAVVGPAALLAAAILGVGAPTLAAVALGVALGSVIYPALFLALSLVTRRAFLVGLLYVFLWEGAAAGLFTGIRWLSVRQAVLALMAAVAPEAAEGRGPDLPLSWPVAGGVVAVAGSLWLAAFLLARLEIRAGD
jgi:ABC-2 type transport system permease protein